MRIRIHSINFSQANGPGRRMVIWVQGCTLSCPGCFNELTHVNLGTEYTVDELFDMIVSNQANIDGVTFTGGEPLQQKKAFIALARKIKSTGLSIVLFTGMTPKELERVDSEIHALCDVILAGRFDPSLWSSDDPLGHKTFIINSDAYYGIEDFYEMPRSEVTIGPDGTMEITGIDPIVLDIPSEVSEVSEDKVMSGLVALYKSVEPANVKLFELFRALEKNR